VASLGGEGTRKDDYEVEITFAGERNTRDIHKYTRDKSHRAKPQDCINALDIVLRQV